ncbi:unnamed protein product [Amaranthus hypochondriacus]
MERIYVTVRARPLSTEDAKSSPWKISGNSISFLNSSSKFDFDKVFGEECKTKEVYEARTQEIVSAAVSGFNGFIFYLLSFFFGLKCEFLLGFNLAAEKLRVDIEMVCC